MREIIQSIIIAIMILGTSGLMTYAEKKGVLADGDERAFGVIIGLLLMSVGNLMPKRSPEATGGNCTSFRVRRFAGWCFVVAGVAHALIWLLAPLSVANQMAMAVVATALVVILVRCATCNWRGPSETG